MRTALAIARKELTIYFTTPWAYAVFTAMTALASFFFTNGCLLYTSPSPRDS